MKIELQRCRIDGWRADCKDLPGSPPVGIGPSKEAAVAYLFMRMLVHHPGSIQDLVRASAERLELTVLE